MEEDLTHPKEERLRPFLLANIAVFVLYIPWFGALFTRLAVDSSYLPGQVKLNELVRHALVSFVGGETILEAESEGALGAFAFVTVVTLCWLGWRSFLSAPKSPVPHLKKQRWDRTFRGEYDNVGAARRTLVLGLCWVLIPCGLILALTLVVPKFNARYVMIALPGLLLLWSVAIGDMLEQKNFGRYFSLGVTLALVTNFSPSIRNWFGDDAFTKAQWREVAQHVRDHKTDGEAVVLVSGHTWPVWDYYAPDMPAVRLPNLEILDVDAALDYGESGTILRDKLTDAQGVWLVRWQDQFVDPMGTAGLHLERAATQVPTDGQFWHLQVEHFTDLRADGIDPQPPIAEQTPVNFGNQLVLLGSEVTEQSDLLLYWTLHENFVIDPAALADVPDYRITGDLRTQANLPYHRLRDRRPVAYEFPTMRWLPGQINVSRISAVDWAGSGALPGDYQLALGVYDVKDKTALLDLLGPNGTPLGKRSVLSLPLPWPLVPAIGASFSEAELDAAHASRVELSVDSAEPGEPIVANVYWRLLPSSWGVGKLTVEWMGGGQLFTQEQPLWPETELPPMSVPQGLLLDVHTVHELRAPLDAPPGDYMLRLLVNGPDVAQSDFVLLASTRSFELPALAQSIGATFGDEIELLGVVDRGLADEDQLSLTLAWRAAERPRTDYFATVQLLDEQGQPLIQSDLALPRGSSNWLPDQVETQAFVLDMSMLDGSTLDSARVIVAVYEPRNNFPRLVLPSGVDYVDLFDLR